MIQHNGGGQRPSLFQVILQKLRGLWLISCNELLKTIAENWKNSSLATVRPQWTMMERNIVHTRKSFFYGQFFKKEWPSMNGKVASRTKRIKKSFSLLWYLFDYDLPRPLKKHHRIWFFLRSDLRSIVWKQRNDIVFNSLTGQWRCYLRWHPTNDLPTCHYTIQK